MNKSHVPYRSAKERGGRKLLSPEETRQRLGLKNVHTLAVWRSTKRYDLPYVKIGRKVFYPEDGVDDFITRNTHCQPGEVA